MTEQRTIALLQQLEALRFEVRASADVQLMLQGNANLQDINSDRALADSMAREASNRDLRERSKEEQVCGCSIGWHTFGDRPSVPYFMPCHTHALAIEAGEIAKRCICRTALADEKGRHVKIDVTCPVHGMTA